MIEIPQLPGARMLARRHVRAASLPMVRATPVAASDKAASEAARAAAGTEAAGAG